MPAIEYPSLAVVREAARRTRSRLGAVLAGLPLLALALLIVAVARPQQGESNATVHASGVDIMLLLDVSGSMQSLDFKLDNLPASRVDVVKSVVRRFIEARPNDRIGLTIFAGLPYLLSPVTLDHAWLLDNLDRVHIGDIEDGTAIGSALAVGTQSSAQSDREVKDRHPDDGWAEQCRPDHADHRGRGRQGAGRQGVHHRHRRTRRGAVSGHRCLRTPAHHHGKGGCG